MDIFEEKVKLGMDGGDGGWQDILAWFLKEKERGFQQTPWSLVALWYIKKGNHPIAAYDGLARGLASFDNGAPQRPPKPYMWIESHRTYRNMTGTCRTVDDEEVEEIIEKEELHRVPIYFYDHYAPIDDYWPIDEVDNLKVEEEGAKEEEFIDNNLLNEVSLNLLFDEGVTDDEIRALKYKIKNADSDSSSDSDSDSDSDSESTQSESSLSSFQTIEADSEDSLVKTPRHNIYFEFDSAMSFENSSNEKEDLENFTLPMINCVDFDNPIFEEEIPKKILEFIEREEERHAKLFSKEIITTNIPKDDFLLPHIDELVDNTAGHALLSFMDGFSGYNQILMSPEDREKTTFTMPWGTYCYRVMPFGLKNTGASYQRMATTLLHNMMRKEVEVYVDDMIVKSKEREGHYEALRKFFERIRIYKLRLNPQKCTFKVTAGKMLGFLITQRGIEVDPSKIQAIMEIPPPKTEKEVRSFLGKVQIISRFISKLTDTCEPLFKLLKKGTDFEWNQDYQ
ncbi:uncharacterized protein LOC131299655 [Rhododendron vialii]|uniref:uncharacterized protein LOC131299655 n=1 Tax=Rhododendron vialii TaxID=182163 RepID=UPI00265E7F78|nr:uncharacterized protein LOC131299655 [Rhododendron vialii]